ncbi:uncharacterized protein ACN63O_009790 [Diretmus argenteus]
MTALTSGAPGWVWHSEPKPPVRCAVPRPGPPPYPTEMLSRLLRLLLLSSLCSAMMPNNFSSPPDPTYSYSMDHHTREPDMPGVPGVPEPLPVLPGSQKGDDGEKGSPGPSGFSGSKGDRGFKGEKGDRGLNGPAGGEGPQGPEGICPDSCDSAEGSPGIPGPPGPPGARGIMGVKGSFGPKGDKGDTGDLGQSGFPGLDGDKGDQGEQGECYCTDGVDGTKGEKGPVGAKGDKGDVGQQGPQGLTGEGGDNGQMGRPGIPGPCSPTIQSAFSAALVTPYPTHTLPIAFPHVITNVQMHYNPIMGIYTAPVNGTYVFSFHLAVFSKVLKVGLFHNYNAVIKSTEATNRSTVSQKVILHLNAGDGVWLQVKDELTNGMYADDESSSTFSGFLLHPDSCELGSSRLGVRSFEISISITIKW